LNFNFQINLQLWSYKKRHITACPPYYGEYDGDGDDDDKVTTKT